ncbi:rna-directed dna polymerase from mobile element jockey-like [Pitangus sulphuratus]|nr:rna-directed dna polymerase from mobile element jockey-like [Pitangus sulphuratus]
MVTLEGSGTQLGAQAETKDERHPQGSVQGLALFKIFVGVRYSGTEAPSASLLMTPSCVEQSTHWREGRHPERPGQPSEMDQPNEVPQGQVQGPASGLGQSQQVQAGREWTESSPEEKNLGVLLDEFKTSWQCARTAQKANHIPGCTKINGTSRSREVILPLNSVSVRSYLERYIQVWGPHHEKDVGLLERGSEEGNEDTQRAGVPLLWRQAERAGVFQPGEKKTPGKP